MNKVKVNFASLREYQIWKAAHELEKYLGENSGDNDDWPVELIARDDESAEILTSLMQNLHDTLKLYED